MLAALDLCRCQPARPTCRAHVPACLGWAGLPYVLPKVLPINPCIAVTLAVCSKAGNFAAGTGSQTCNTCAPGYYSSTDGASTCARCGGGKYTVNVDGAGATSCLFCAKGTYKPEAAEDNKCRSCPIGHETGLDDVGATTCTECKKGYFSAQPNTALCSACAPATYAKDTGSKTCRVCPAGTVTGLTQTNHPTLNLGATALAAFQCDNCPRRTFRPSMYAANVCTPCPKGRETRKEAGASTCLACTPGYSLLMNATLWDLSCTACKAGELPLLVLSCASA